jgi:TPR repeat protein
MYPPAINKLGHCYFSGFGVKMDKMIAIGYYKQAAEEDNDEALVNLGTAYLMGIDKVLDKNPVLAY